MLFRSNETAYEIAICDWSSDVCSSDLFDGTIDWPATLMAMWKIGYDGNFVFEVADHGDAGSVLQRTVGARTRLQAILKGLAEPIEFDEQ